MKFTALHSFGYSYHTTPEKILKNIYLTNKTILLTGATNGIGLKTALHLLKHKAKLIVAVRNIELAKKRFAKYQAVDIFYLDLSKYESIYALVDELKTKNIRIDILINNAGILPKKSKVLDKNNTEATLKINFISPAILTIKLLPYIQDNGRIIFVSSVAHKWSKVYFDDLNFSLRRYSASLAYGQSKTALILFAKQLSILLKSKNISVFSVHPGIIPLSNIWIPRRQPLKGITIGLLKFLDLIHFTAFMNLFAPLLASNLIYRFKSLDQGASTTIFAATNNEITKYSGSYLEDCAIYPMIDEKVAVGRGLAFYANDESDALRVYELVLRIIAKIEGK